MTLSLVFHRTVRYLFSPHSKTMLSFSSPQKLLVLLLLTVLLLCPPRVQGFGVCRASFRCFNGGVERYGTSIFSPCRCQCKTGYTGPRCQYREAYGKRSSSLQAITQFLQASLRQQAKLVNKREDEDFEEKEEDEEAQDLATFLALPRKPASRRRLHPRFFRR